jgi:hypothetical protein
LLDCNFKNRVCAPTKPSLQFWRFSHFKLYEFCTNIAKFVMFLSPILLKLRSSYYS